MWGRAGDKWGREGRKSVSRECREWEHGGHSWAGKEGRGHKSLLEEAFRIFFPDVDIPPPKTLSRRRRFGSSLLLLPELLFFFSFPT